MTERSRTEDENASRTGAPFRMRLPGFISEDEVGLGDAVKRVTYAFDITPCGGCEQRAVTLNRWVRFTR